MEALRKRNAELEADLVEQCRLNSMGSEREAKLLTRVQQLEVLHTNFTCTYTIDLDILHARIAELETELDGMKGTA